MKCSQLFIISFCLITITSCYQVKKTKKDAVFSHLIGIDVSFVDSLFVFNDKEKPRVFLICSVYDCGSCLDNAFSELKILNRALKPSTVQVVGVLSDPTPLQIRFEYFDYIAYDADDVIRRRLKFIPTPVFMVLDENNVVRYLHRPTAADVPMSVAMLLKKHCSPRAVPD